MLGILTSSSQFVYRYPQLPIEHVSEDRIEGVQRDTSLGRGSGGCSPRYKTYIGRVGGTEAFVPLRHALLCTSACWRDVQQTRNVVNRRTVGAWLIAVGKGVRGFSVRLGRSVLSSPEL